MKIILLSIVTLIVGVFSIASAFMQKGEYITSENNNES